MFQSLLVSQSENQLSNNNDNFFSWKSERNILKKLSERETDQNLSFATTQTELKAAILSRVKNVTGAKDDICISMLESNGYDMKASIEAFYAR